MGFWRDILSDPDTELFDRRPAPKDGHAVCEAIERASQNKIDRLESALSAATARAEAAERLAVWAVRNCPSIGITTAHQPTLNWYDPPQALIPNRRVIRLDGTTDADLLRALKAASGIA